MWILTRPPMKQKLLVLISFLLLLLGSANVLDCHCTTAPGCSEELATSDSHADFCAAEHEETSNCCMDCGYDDSSLAIVDSQTQADIDEDVAPLRVTLSQTLEPKRIASISLYSRPPPPVGVKWQVSHCVWLI